MELGTLVLHNLLLLSFKIFLVFDFNHQLDFSVEINMTVFCIFSLHCNKSFSASPFSLFCVFQILLTPGGNKFQHTREHLTESLRIRTNNVKEDNLEILR